jgi:hypothetical protein
MTKYSSYTQLQLGTGSTSAMTSVILLQYTGAVANVPPPKVRFQEAVVFSDVADGSVKLLGKPQIVWEWPNGINYSARQALRAFIATGVTATAYIASPDRSGDIQNYRTVMKWPAEALAYQSFEYAGPLTITFTRCVQL